MAEKIGSKVIYFLVGLGIGSLIGILFAPKSGEKTREYLAQKAESAQKKVREMRERAEDLVERRKEVVAQKKEQIAAAVDVGHAAYQREKSKAQGA